MGRPLWQCLVSVLFSAARPLLGRVMVVHVLWNAQRSDMSDEDFFRGHSALKKADRFTLYTVGQYYHKMGDPWSYPDAYQDIIITVHRSWSTEMNTQEKNLVNHVGACKGGAFKKTNLSHDKFPIKIDDGNWKNLWKRKSSWKKLVCVLLSRMACVEIADIFAAAGFFCLKKSVCNFLSAGRKKLIGLNRCF